MPNDKDASRPDLSNIRLVDPADFGHQPPPLQEPPRDAPETDAVAQFGLEFDVDEAEHKFGADRYDGTIRNRSGEGLYGLWSVACVNPATRDCIDGTCISELSVKDDVDGRCLMTFENGQWRVEPKGNRDCVIRDSLIGRFGETIDATRPNAMDDLIEA